MALFRCAAAFVVLLLLTSFGCNRGPRAIPALYVDPGAASQKAMDLNDSDSNGVISENELEAAAGLMYAADRADSDGDGALSKAEIAEMIEGWNSRSVGLLTLRCSVKIGGRALSGAKITFEPEPFLEGEIEPAFGLTDEFGDAYLSVPKENRPVSDAPPGVQLGLYRVRISKEVNGRETIASRYNSETELGQEVAFDDPGVANGIVYSLKK